ncbi:DUF1643 domain-containing protein [Ornithinibacillus salinisoli]|uniref:DUF1643 domain-containing protein n=1 Tax=Ornithinibacillus salinisoli TaxID=1848459 RepID=A0ABW4W215_9BACI
MNVWFEQLANSNNLSIQTGSYESILGKAIFNTNGTRRYFLEKRWEQGGNILTAIMMNPSNAAHNQTDDTVDQLINVARVQLGYNALYVVNVSSIIDGSSSKLTKEQFAYEPINWNFISGAVSHANVIFLGWGMKGQQGMLKHQESNSELVNAFKNVSSKIYCYDVLKSGDKKFVNKPIYYVPHPRPIFEKEKYCESLIRPMKDHEFIQIFVR